MIIFCQSFTAECVSVPPKKAREAAVMFANKVNESGDVINVTETADACGNTVIVWYKSIKKVEV